MIDPFNSPLTEVMDFIFNSFNEVAIGYIDCSDEWVFSYGLRGSGSMIKSCGRRWYLSEIEHEDGRIDIATFEEAVRQFANFILEKK